MEWILHIKVICAVTLQRFLVPLLKRSLGLWLDLYLQLFSRLNHWQGCGESLSNITSGNWKLSTLPAKQGFPRFYWGFLAWSYNSQVAQRLSFHDGVPQFPCKRPEWGNRECCETRRWRIIPLVNHKMTKYYNIVESIQNVCIYNINQSESKRLTNQLACFYLSSLCFDSAKQKKTLRSVLDLRTHTRPNPAPWTHGHLACFCW